MDRIEAAKQPSRFVTKPHLVILVNGVPFDELIAAGAGRDDLRGLVATLDLFLWNDSDRRLAWERFSPEVGQRERAPALVCPDDADFDCTTVVVEIERLKDRVLWHRIGFGLATSTDIGSDVDWLTTPGGFEFSAADYESFLGDSSRTTMEW